MPRAVLAARFDGPWKAAIERWLPECLALFAAHVHAAIDWEQGLTFLDTELARIAPDAASSGGIVDKLVRVSLIGGGSAFVLIHVEVQNQRDPDFSRRMFRYHTRLLDQFDLPVYSLAILGDPHATWRPSGFQQALWDCRLDFAFPIIKLLDFAGRADLDANANPFVSIVLGHLAALETRKDVALRYRSKMELVRRLYGLGYNREQIVESYWLLDWLLRLPKAVDQQFHTEVLAYEQEQHVTYISSAERIGIAKGRKEGRQEGRVEGRVEGRAEGLALAVRMKFGTDGEALAEAVAKVTDAARLDQLARLLLAGASLAELAASQK